MTDQEGFLFPRFQESPLCAGFLVGAEWEGGGNCIDANLSLFPSKLYNGVKERAQINREENGND